MAYYIFCRSRYVDSVICDRLVAWRISELLENEIARIIDNATAVDNGRIHVVDTTFRITPQLSLSDAVTIRTQVDVASNMIWGGVSSNFFGGTANGVGIGDSVVLSDLRPSDRLRGSILTGDKAL